MLYAAHVRSVRSNRQSVGQSLLDFDDSIVVTYVLSVFFCCVELCIIRLLSRAAVLRSQLLDGKRPSPFDVSLFHYQSGWHSLAPSLWLIFSAGLRPLLAGRSLPSHLQEGETRNSGET